MNEPLLFLPGMMCDERLFEAQIDALSERHPVTVAPLTGHDTIEQLARSILLNAPPRFALAGLSMGGIVAMEIIRQAPARVSRLALLDTNPQAESAERAAARDAQMTRVSNGALLEIMRDEMKPQYLAAGPDTGRILDLCMRMATSLGPQVFIDQSRALQTRRDQLDTLATVNVPALVLCGEHDTLCPVAKHELMRDQIPRARWVVIDDAGHLPTLEQPERTSRALVDWIAT